MNRILIIDDEPSICEVLSGILEDEGYEVVTAEDGILGLRVLEQDDFDLVILDVWLPGKGGIDVLKEIKEKFSHIEVVIITGHGTIDMAVKSIKLGSFDFLEKPLSLERVVTVVRNALALETLRKENKALKDSLFMQDEMIGSGEAMQRIRRLIVQSAGTDSRILITGENGTGKELVAKEIHRKSGRVSRPFVEVNCAAIPDTLIESELFGHEKGAFTHALSRKRGRFEMADTGTIFLDEVADMSLSAQSKVLRVIQEMKFERIGGESSITVDVRIVAATNKDLRIEIDSKRFREDLFFRLNVIPIHVPALRERREDIPDLIDYFLEKFGSTKGKGEKKEISPEGRKILTGYSWPGNIRELKNFIERITIMSEQSVVSEETVRHYLGEETVDPVWDSLQDYSDLKLNAAKDLFEKRLLEKKLAENSYVVSKTAEALGIYPSNLHNKIKKLGIAVEK